MNQIFGYSLPIPLWLVLSIFLACWVAFSFLISRIFDRLIRRWTERRKNHLGQIFIQSIHTPFLVFLLLMGGWIALGAVDLTPQMARFAQVGISLATAFICIFAGVKIYQGLLMEYGQRYEPIKPSLSILNLLGKGLIILVVLLITLDSLNISITPLLTTLGIGGLAVALAFKDTLTNFFAGLYILADRPILVGDYIKIEGGPEGYVEEVGWRSTRIRTLPNNIVILPNSRVSESIITNYFLPDRRMALVINVSVGYGSDTRKVERILLEEASRAALEIQGMLPEPPPAVRFIPGFRESSLDFSVICQVREFADQYFVQHELRHRILERLRKEEVEIPFPQRTVYLRGENR
jgi:small-conductance mechanosensitive channel